MGYIEILVRNSYGRFFCKECKPSCFESCMFTCWYPMLRAQFPIYKVVLAKSFIRLSFNYSFCIKLLQSTNLFPWREITSIWIDLFLTQVFLFEHPRKIYYLSNTSTRINSFDTDPWYLFFKFALSCIYIWSFLTILWNFSKLSFVNIIFKQFRNKLWPRNRGILLAARWKS